MTGQARGKNPQTPHRSYEIGVVVDDDVVAENEILEANRYSEGLLLGPHHPVTISETEAADDTPDHRGGLGGHSVTQPIETVRPPYISVHDQYVGPMPDLGQLQ